MAKKKVVDEWVLGNEAAEILTKNSGHKVTPNYVRILAGKNLIRWRRKDGRTNEYHKGDLMAYKVEFKSKTDRQSGSDGTAEDGLPSAA